MTNFYVLGTIPVGPYHTTFLPIKPNHLADPPRCPECEGYLGMMVWLPPYRATVIASFSKLGDVTSELGYDVLVSERFRRAWEERNLKGIKEFAQLERLRIRPPRLAKPGIAYYQIRPETFGTSVDFTGSHFKYGGIITCTTCKTMPDFKSVRGFRIEPSSWTGEDMFRPWGFRGTVVVTDRVRQLRDDYDLKNVELTPIEEYSYPPEYKASTDK